MRISEIKKTEDIEEVEYNDDDDLLLYTGLLSCEDEHDDYLINKYECIAEQLMIEDQEFLT